MEKESHISSLLTPFCQEFAQRVGLFSPNFLDLIEKDPQKAWNEVSELLSTIDRLLADDTNNISIPDAFILRLKKLKCEIASRLKVDQFEPEIMDMEMFPVEDTGTTRGERGESVGEKRPYEIFYRDRWALEVLLSMDAKIDPKQGDYLQKDGTLLFVIKSPGLGKAILVSRKQGRATFVVPLNNWEEYAQRSRDSLLREAQDSDAPVKKVIMPRHVHGEEAIPIWKEYFREALKEKLPPSRDGYSTINNFANEHAEELGKSVSSISRKTRGFVHQILKKLSEEQTGEGNALTQLKKDAGVAKVVERVRAQGGARKKNGNENGNGEANSSKKSVIVVHDEILKLVLDQMKDLCSLEDYPEYKTCGQIVKELREETGSWKANKKKIEEILQIVLEEKEEVLDIPSKKLWGQKKIDWYYHPEVVKEVKSRYQKSCE